MLKKILLLLSLSLGLIVTAGYANDLPSIKDCPPAAIIVHSAYQGEAFFNRTIADYNTYILKGIPFQYGQDQHHDYWWHPVTFYICHGDRTHCNNQLSNSGSHYFRSIVRQIDVSNHVFVRIKGNVAVCFYAVASAPFGNHYVTAYSSSSQDSAPPV